MMIDEKKLVSLFLYLAQIHGTSGDERAVADFVKGWCDEHGLTAVEDDAGETFGGDAGNLTIRLDGTGGAPMLLMAHMDTVSSTAGLNPVVEEGMIRSDGTTILGSDDRAGMAVILYALDVLRKRDGKHRSLEVVFTVGEETGMHGALALDETALRSKEGYILDCSRPVGCYVSQTPTAVDLTIDFKGKASHSGVAIKNGINALSMAVEVLDRFPVGQVDDQTTANVGTIEGGEAVNIVPETVSVTGEIRSFNDHTIHRMLSDLKSHADEVADLAGGEIEIRDAVAFHGFHLKPELDVICRLEKSLKDMEFVPDPLVYYGGSDANVINRKGIHAVNLGVGVQNPHAKNECIPINALMQTAELVLRLLEVDV